MREYTEKNKKYTVSKIMQIFLLIFIIPVLLIATFSVIIMINSKNMGGYPNLFDNTLVQIQDESFYNPVTEKFKVGEYEMFKSALDYKKGDIIAYYSERSENQVFVDLIVWDDITSELQNTSNSNIQTIALDATTETAEVSIGKIANIGRVNVANNQEFVCYSIYTSNNDMSDTDSAQNPIPLLDVIGVNVEASDFIKSFMVYCASFDSFITLILIPCVLLFAINLISLILRRSYDREEFYGNKEIIRMQELEREGSLEEGRGKKVSAFTRMFRQKPAKYNASDFDESPITRRTPPPKPVISPKPTPPQKPTPPSRPSVPQKPSSPNKIPPRPPQR